MLTPTTLTVDNSPAQLVYGQQTPVPGGPIGSVLIVNLGGLFGFPGPDLIWLYAGPNHSRIIGLTLQPNAFPLPPGASIALASVDDIYATADTSISTLGVIGVLSP